MPVMVTGTPLRKRAAGRAAYIAPDHGECRGCHASRSGLAELGHNVEVEGIGWTYGTAAGGCAQARDIEQDVLCVERTSG